MRTKFLEISACAALMLASPLAVAKSPSQGVRIATDDSSTVKQRTNAEKNGTMQSESPKGENKNGAMQSDEKKTGIQGQTDPKRNGTSQSESLGGGNKNGQPQ